MDDATERIHPISKGFRLFGGGGHGEASGAPWSGECPIMGEKLELWEWGGGEKGIEGERLVKYGVFVMPPATEWHFVRRGDCRVDF